MKILSIGNFGRGWDNSLCDEEHIAGALEELGHEVIRGQRGQENVYLSMNTKPYDFILIAQWDGYEKNFAKNTSETLNIGKTDKPCPVVYWAFDYQADGQVWHERLVKEADLYLSKRIADSKYSNWQYLSQDFAPSFLFAHSIYNFDRDIQVLFTGSYLDWAVERNEILKAVDEKFNLVIHSVNDWPGFKDVRPPIMDEGLPELYSRAWVILSIDHTLEAGYWSDRNAQIMCCGARPVFRYVPLSENTFHNHVDYFYNKEDCLQKIEDILINGQQLMVDSHYFAQNNLKVHNRVQDLLTIVESIL